MFENSQEINTRKKSGGKRPLSVKSWSTVKDVKQTLQSLLHVPSSKQRLFFQGRELGEKGKLRELKSQNHSLQDCGLIRDGETLYFAITPVDDSSKGAVLRSYGLLNSPRKIHRIINQVRRAFDLGVNAPKLTMEGFGGTYFMFDPKKRPVGKSVGYMGICRGLFLDSIQRSRDPVSILFIN